MVIRIKFMIQSSPLFIINYTTTQMIPTDQTKTLYQKCDVPGHQAEDLNIICQESSCDRCLICSVCRYEKHQHHQTILAKILIHDTHETIEKLAENRSESAINKLITHLEGKENEIVKNLKDLQQKFYDVTEKLIATVKGNFKNYTEEAKRNSAVSIVKGVINRKSVSEILSLHKFLTNEPTEKINNYQTMIKKNVEEMESYFVGWGEKVQDSEQKSLMSWVKHPSLSLNNNRLKSTSTTTYKIAYLESMLGKEEKTFRVKIHEDNNNWVGLGICHKSIIDANKCVFMHNDKKHGCYMINSNGSVWTSTEPQLNGSVKSFKFKKGDIIQIVYHPESKRLKFKKEGSKNAKESYELKMEVEEWKDVRFGMLFYYVNDEMELLGV